MAINLKRLNEYIRETEIVINILKENQDLFAQDKLIEFKQNTTDLINKTEVLMKDSRKLSIGVIGSVKAGKSSFLNSCIFEGTAYLPKAATPMTAVLTKITYSNKPKGIIHFYTEEDWETIKELSVRYDEGLEKEYSQYKERNKKKRRQEIGYMTDGTISDGCMSKEDFEKTYKCKSENQRGAKELIRMAKDPMLMKQLGKTQEIEGDIILQMEDYVGAKGRYTPIVSYVELQVDDKYMENIEIVDTPGLNDPVVSRGIRTKRFLTDCDVVLLLSPCSQFMNSGTINLMVNTLPNAGIKEVLVVGSKLDSGILNESGNSFKAAYLKSLASYRKQFSNSLRDVQRLGRHMDRLNKIRDGKLLFTSSMCDVINRKLKKGQKLADNEEFTYKNLCKYEDFEDRYLVSLGGMQNVKKALNEVLERKREIVEARDKELLERTSIGHLQVLEKILQEVYSSKTLLRTASSEELKQRVDIIKSCIAQSRSKLMNTFEIAAAKCDARIQEIRPQLMNQIQAHQNIDVTHHSQTKHVTQSSGLFGLVKKTHEYEEIHNSANTASVINNITQYAAECHKYVNNEFKNIFNKEELSRQIKEIVLFAFQESKVSFSEDDILLPLQSILEKIVIPHITIDFAEYIDEVETRFSHGVAEDSEIHELNALQMRLLKKIENEFTEQLLKALAEIDRTLNQLSVKFADQIEADLCAELEKLNKQVGEKNRYIKKYCNFEDVIKKLKGRIAPFI